MSEFFENYLMMLFGLEVGVVLFLFIFVVIWMMLGVKKYLCLLCVLFEYLLCYSDVVKFLELISVVLKNLYLVKFDVF